MCRDVVETANNVLLERGSGKLTDDGSPSAPSHASDMAHWKPSPDLVHYRLIVALSIIQTAALRYSVSFKSSPRWTSETPGGSVHPVGIAAAVNELMALRGCVSQRTNKYCTQLTCVYNVRQLLNATANSGLGIYTGAFLCLSKALCPTPVTKLDSAGLY
jgi:hypothetical protein